MVYGGGRIVAPVVGDVPEVHPDENPSWGAPAGGNVPRIEQILLGHFVVAKLVVQPAEVFLDVLLHGIVVASLGDNQGLLAFIDRLVVPELRSELIRHSGANLGLHLGLMKASRVVNGFTSRRCELGGRIDATSAHTRQENEC